MKKVRTEEGLVVEKYPYEEEEIDVKVEGAYQTGVFDGFMFGTFAFGMLAFAVFVYSLFQ